MTRQPYLGVAAIRRRGQVGAHDACTAVSLCSWRLQGGVQELLRGVRACWALRMGCMRGQLHSQAPVAAHSPVKPTSIWMDASCRTGETRDGRQELSSRSGTAVPSSQTAPARQLPSGAWKAAAGSTLMLEGVPC